MNKMQSSKEQSSISNRENVAQECRHIELINLDHEKESKQQKDLPPDGGIRAYLVLVSAFISYGVTTTVVWYYGSLTMYSFHRITDLHGTVHCAPVILTSFMLDNCLLCLCVEWDQESLQSYKKLNGFSFGFYFMNENATNCYYRFFAYNNAFIMAPIAAILADKIGLQYTSMAGGVLTTSGLFFSPYFLHDSSEFNLTYFVLGCQIMLGTALSLTSAYAILGHYFKRHLGKASGFVAMSWLLMFTLFKDSSFEDDRRFKLQMLSLISSVIIVCSITFKPLNPLPKKCFRVDFDKWKLLKFLIYAIGVTIAIFGFIVDGVPMSLFLSANFSDKRREYFGNIIHYFAYIGGYLVFGIIADLRCVNRFMVQQIVFACIGLGNIVMTFISNFILVEVLAMTLCLLQCCFLTFICPIVFEMFGPSGTTHALGILLSLWECSRYLGNEIFYYAYDKCGSVEAPFMLVGLFPIIGAVVMFGALRLLDRYIRK